METKTEALLIQLMYPEIYCSAKALFDFDKKVENLINDYYGVETIDHIFKMNEYNREIENVKNSIFKNTNFSKFAQKRKILFDTYANETFLISQQIGKENTFAIMNTLELSFV
jgi:hypothetical protein